MEIRQTPITPSPPVSQPKFDFPTEIIELPSKGYLYSAENPLSSGKIEIKYMTAQHEDILTNQSYLKSGIAIDKLLQSLIATPGVNYDDLLIGDKNGILFASRILGYGKDYTFTYEDTNTGYKEDITFDLSKLETKPLDENVFKPGMKNEFDFELPVSKAKVTFRFLTHKDEREIEQEVKGLKKIKPDGSFDIATRLKYLILSVNGDYEKKTIREFIDKKLLARDARALREHIGKIQPDVDTNISFDLKNGSTQEGTLPMTVDFFWPRS